jgi:hypothetical protein
MPYVDYDPTKHTDLPLFAIEDGAPTADGIPMILRRVTAKAELESARSVPFYYVVEVGEAETERANV